MNCSTLLLLRDSCVRCEMVMCTAMKCADIELIIISDWLPVNEAELNLMIVCSERIAMLCYYQFAWLLTTWLRLLLFLFPYSVVVMDSFCIPVKTDPFHGLIPLHSFLWLTWQFVRFRSQRPLALALKMLALNKYLDVYSVIEVRSMHQTWTLYNS